jgi:multiple sugar transport system substrate-binding protein
VSRRTTAARRWALPALFALACTVASAGSVATAQAASTRNLVFTLAWSGPTGLIQTMDAIVNDYNKTHAGDGVHWTVEANYDEQKLLAAVAAGDPPAASMMGTTAYVPTYAAKGAILNLTSYIKKSKLNLNQFTYTSLYSNSLLGVQYALPFFEDTYGLYYNKTLFAEAGIKNPPTTLQQLAADARKMTKTGANGQYTQLGFNPSSIEDEYEVQGLLYGGRYASPSGVVTLDSAAVLKGNQWLVNFFHAYDPTKLERFLSSNAGAASTLDPFTAGKVAMDVSGEWYMPTIAQEAPHLDYGVAPIPYPAGEPQFGGAGSVGGNPMVIPKGSSDPQAAYNLIEWLTTTGEEIGAQPKYYQYIQAVPALKSLVVNGKLAGNPKMAFFWRYSAGKNVVSFPPVPDEITYLTDMDNALQKAELGKISLDAAFQQVQAQVAPIVAGDLAAWRASQHS